MTGLRPYTEDTRQDAFAVISDRFSPKDCRIAEKYLQNPLLSNGGAGDVAYEHDKPVGFQAAIRRRLYLGKTQLIGVVGGMLAMQEKASPVLLVNLMKATVAPRDGSSFFYANTANITSMKMNRMLGVKGTGPATCERTRFAVVFVPWGFRWMCTRPHARRLYDIDPKIFDGFWNSYLATNKGLVSSRTSEELTWIFGDRLKTGEIALLGEFKEQSLLGYIVLKVNSNRRRVLIIDWIALKNDKQVLDSLLVSAVRFARRETNAIFLESIGFPSFSEDISRRRLGWVRKARNNTFIWKFPDGRTEIPAESWFFGPYDGDRCM